MSVEASAPKDPDGAAVPVPGIVAVTTSQIQLGADVADDVAYHRAGSIGVPFVDFVGRCFLRACLWMDLLESWKQEKRALPDAGIESAASGGYQGLGWVRLSVGAISCTAVAACVTPFFLRSELRSLVPLLFLLVILYVALRFGHIAGILGTICAALVFEIFLFEPRLSLAISNPASRKHLISMVVLGICASELLGRRKTPAVYKPW